MKTRRSIPSRMLIAGTGLSLAAATTLALASSHREAPFLAMQPSVDATDLYCSVATRVVGKTM